MSLDFDRALDRLKQALLQSDDPLQPLRRDAARHAAASVGLELPGEALDESWHRYLDKVSREPYKVIDRDVEALREAGMSKEQIFDATVAAAVGASLARLQLARELIQSTKDEA